MLACFFLFSFLLFLKLLSEKNDIYLHCLFFFREEEKNSRFLTGTCRSVGLLADFKVAGVQKKHGKTNHVTFDCQHLNHS